MQSLLYLPSFVADNRTEDLFRNIMALEQCHYPFQAYLCNYMVLLDHLINTSEDVELLVDKGIIVNALGSYQEVANMVNKIALEIAEENSRYSDVAKNLRNHYQNGCNRNIEYLKSIYFSDLWRGTATVVGFIFLEFTLWDFVSCRRSHYFGGLATSASGMVGGDTNLAAVVGNTILELISLELGELGFCGCESL
nr:putative upf0481 protein [Quercus suber]